VSDVIDASAALAWLRGEPGAEVVEPRLAGGLISAVNWAEVLQKSRRAGIDLADTSDLFGVRGLTVMEATKGDARLAASYWEPGTSLSIADRFCLALAYRFDSPAVTAERAWATLDVGVEVVVIR